MNGKGSSYFFLIWGTIHASVWRSWGKPRKS